MNPQTLNRFEWLKAAMQSEDLNPAAKNVATALALQFANDETGQINPSVSTLASYLKTSKDTVKRAVRALVEGGWIARTEGRGAGNKTLYTLCSPGKIIAISSMKTRAETHPQKGCKSAPSIKQKGANLHGKGCKSAPSYNKDKQSFEQKGATLERFRNYSFPGNAVDGLQLVNANDQHRLNAWAEWLDREGFPQLHALSIKRTESRKGAEFFALPYRNPPTEARQVSEARAFFEAMTAEEIAA